MPPAPHLLTWTTSGVEVTGICIWAAAPVEQPHPSNVQRRLRQAQGDLRLCAAAGSCDCWGVTGAPQQGQPVQAVPLQGRKCEVPFVQAPCMGAAVGGWTWGTGA